MTQQQHNPLGSLRSAEAALVQQYDAATALVAGVGCGSLDAAQARFTRTVAAAVERVRSHRQYLTEQLGGLLGEMVGFTADLRDGLGEPAIVLPLASPVLRVAIDEDGDEGDDLEDDHDLGGEGRGATSRDAEYEARLLLMRGAIFNEPALSNRELVRRFGGNNATARQARLLNAVDGAPLGVPEMAAAAPQRE